MRFAWHYIEMVIAMFAGMMILAPLLSAAGLGFSHARDPELAYLLMAFEMSAGMAVWMRFRRHGWAVTLEMCGAMFAPAVPLFPALWLGIVDGGTMMVLAHVAMFPLMLVVMLKHRHEHTAGHS
jgi:hypothetical protein